MTKLDKLELTIRKHKPILAERFKVKEIALFGSFIRGENKKNSDLDILVDFSEPIGLFAFMDLEEYIKNLVKAKKVDLVTKKSLKPYIGKQILREAVAI
jgi:predicted nucleotidyltransferase